MKGLKGIEPVIAVVILVAISIAMAGMLFTWYQGTLRIEQERTASAAECAFASLEVGDVFLSAEGGRVIIENTGQHSLDVSLIVLQKTDGLESFLMNSTVEERSLASLPFPFTGSCGNFVSLTVYTACNGIDARFSGEPVCG
ncbi:MAG: hypothetical protein HYW25_02820 [Candidatus Aenigmarchaeota archaeon]|nr:hypothetical protein [Candidatus Aenigmarchaeota archaeon]